MEKIQSVSSLKLGDKFEFVADRTDGTKRAVMIVIRAPAVNLKANSCHFRYQADASPTDAQRKWDDNQSWNGTPDVRVRLLESAPAPIPVVPAVVAPAVVVPAAVVPAVVAPVVVKVAAAPVPVEKAPVQSAAIEQAPVEVTPVKKATVKKRAVAKPIVIKPTKAIRRSKKL
jgi:hypothetical protein